MRQGGYYAGLPSTSACFQSQFSKFVPIRKRQMEAEGQSVRHEGLADQRMRDPRGEGRGTATYF